MAARQVAQQSPLGVAVVCLGLILPGWSILAVSISKHFHIGSYAPRQIQRLRETVFTTLYTDMKAKCADWGKRYSQCCSHTKGKVCTLREREEEGKKGKSAGQHQGMGRPRFSKSQRAVENREKWKKLVAKSSVVPQWPSRLRGWWWWWFTMSRVKAKCADWGKWYSQCCTLHEGKECRLKETVFTMLYTTRRQSVQIEGNGIHNVVHVHAGEVCMLFTWARDEDCHTLLSGHTRQLFPGVW